MNTGYSLQGGEKQGDRSLLTSPTLAHPGMQVTGTEQGQLLSPTESFHGAEH